MNPWDMMNMMSQMWGGCGGKGWGGQSDWKQDRSGGSSNSGPYGSKPGDWVCTSCGNVNFSNRDKCNKCGKERGQGQQRLGMKPGDWICHNCGDLVFASKSQCKMCGTPKPEEMDGGLSGSRPSSRYSPY